MLDFSKYKHNLQHSKQRRLSFIKNEPVDSVSVQGNIIDVEPDSSQVLLRHDSLLGGPLESSHHRVLDLVQVLHSLGTVHQDVGTGTLGAEAPDLTGLGEVVLVLIAQVTRTRLEIVTGVNFTLESKLVLGRE